MELYFSPLACSMATRIALYEAGADADFHEIDPKIKRTRDGRDFHDVSPLGFVPVLRTDDGEILTENTAILQYVAELFPDAELVPTDPFARSRLRQWLSFITTEIHKVVFSPLFDKTASDEIKAYAREKVIARLKILDQHLTGREFLLDRFTVADAYLVTILNWTAVTQIDLTTWPAVSAYAARLRARPSVARAMSEESRLYAEERSRHEKAAKAG